MHDPLAIFEERSRPISSALALTEFEELLKSGRTVAYRRLPDLLKAKTSFELPNRLIYEEVGALRNTVQHFVVPEADYARLVLTYLCRVADPILRHFWNLQVFQEIYDKWGEDDYYLFRDEPWFADALKEHGVEYDGWLPTPETTGSQEI